MKDLLKDILLLVKWSTVSTEYFGKSRTWIYQRISNYDVNGKPAEFSAQTKHSLPMPYAMWRSAFSLLPTAFRRNQTRQ